MILGLFAASGCTAELEAPPASSEDEGAFIAAEPEEDALGTSEGALASGTVSAFGGCPGAYPSCTTCGPYACGQTCCATEREPGFEFSYPDDCSSWTRPAWQPTSDPPLVCHIDPDRHWDGVEIEIYAAKRYQDTSCAPQPSRWQKDKVAEVDCSWWTALTDGSTCGRRVLNKVTELAAAGYAPFLPNPEGDNCPTGSAPPPPLLPPPPPPPPPPPNDDPCSNCRGGTSCFCGDDVCRPRTTACP
ncbi:hypothetical protein WMF27_04060 [Sorangium sp. So ce281]|uniref:hypothetical protein n=1 Tax=unclassified Sorangium TaxID=2621164 RepID=UPI003F5D93FD